MIEPDFLTCARTIGWDRRIAELIADCDRAWPPSASEALTAGGRGSPTSAAGWPIST